MLNCASGNLQARQWPMCINICSDPSLVTGMDLVKTTKPVKPTDARCIINASHPLLAWETGYYTACSTPGRTLSDSAQRPSEISLCPARTMVSRLPAYYSRSERGWEKERKRCGLPRLGFICSRIYMWGANVMKPQCERYYAFKADPEYKSSYFPFSFVSIVMRGPFNNLSSRS